jgi:Xaa-Pro aminopeptidase
VVTDKGRDVLSDFVPRDMVSIEKIMKEEGLLERYPRAD